MSKQAAKIEQLKNELKNIGLFTSEQNQDIQAIKSDIVMLSDVCKREAALFQSKFGNEWKNLSSVQHTLKVINTNIMLLDKKNELFDTYIADIYDRLTKISTIVMDTMDTTETP